MRGHTNMRQKISDVCTGVFWSAFSRGAEGKEQKEKNADAVDRIFYEDDILMGNTFFLDV